MKTRPQVLESAHLWSQMHLHGCVCWPVAHGQYVHGQVYGAWVTLILHVLQTQETKTDGHLTQKNHSIKKRVILFPNYSLPCVFICLRPWNIVH